MRFSFIAVSLLLLGACGGSGSDESMPPDSAPEQLRSIQATFAVLDKFGVQTNEFSAGEPITFRLTVVNTSASPVTYTASRPNSDVMVQQGVELIWSPHFDKAFLAIVDTAVIGPGQTVATSFEWRGTDTQSNLLPPGRYVAIPVLNWWVDEVDVPVVPASQEIVLR